MYQRIRDLREDHDFTQKFVANLLSFSHANYAKIERGEVVLTADVLVKLSKLYDVSTDYLLGLTDCPDRIKRKIK
ncbi:TPA: helix-turn-helix domain-containing protein [Streptococcus suis]